MRALAIVLVLLVGCGGKHAGKTGPGAVATVFPSARWVPAKATYVVSARSFRDAQRGFADLVDTVGVVLGMDARDISAIMQLVLQVDVLSADAMAAIGIDPDGSSVMFSENLEPTFVLHLRSADALHGFFDKQRERGLVSSSVVVDGVPVQTAKLPKGMQLSWAIDKEWLWVHLANGDAGTAWFEHSRHPADTEWVAKWENAKPLATKPAGLIGFVDVRIVLAELAARVPALHACSLLVEPVTSAGFVVESEGSFAGGKLGLQIGASAGSVASKLLAPPPGWNLAAQKAPLSAQWNLDLKAVTSWLAPCARAFNEDLGFVDQFGVRTGRAFVYSLDVDDKSGTGAIALDLTNRRYFAQLLDQVPLRSKFERNRMFGAYKGKHLSVPFVATADYVLDDRVFIAAMGDGILDRVANGNAPAQPAVLAVDIVPSGLPAGVWQWLLTQAGFSSAKQITERLRAWKDIHVWARLEGQTLVIEAAGNRR